MFAVLWRCIAELACQSFLSSNLGRRYIDAPHQDETEKRFPLTEFILRHPQTPVHALVSQLKDSKLC